MACDTFKERLITLKINNGTILGCDLWRYMTQAQLAMAIYQTKFLKPNTIRIHVEHNDQASKESLQCLASFSEQEHIRSAINGHEKKLFGRKVDGYCEQTKTVYLFHGYYFNGYRRCYGSLNHKELKNY